MNRLLTILNDRKYDYSVIYSHGRTIKRLSLDERDINFIIGVKGRTEYFRACIQNILIAASNTDLKVKIIVVEQDDNPVNLEFCEPLDVDYIFLPIEVSNSENLHSTALMYNVGYLFSKQGKWNMFHCCDTLVPHNFFDVLDKNYLNNDFNWIQPFEGKRVTQMTTDSTNKYLSGEFNTTDPSELTPDHLTGSQPASGAPGGSILIPTELFDKVGGYDPELFYGYSIEDSFIWGKLESASIDERITAIHYKGGTYAENPPLRIYHLDHPSSQSDNSKFNEMLEYHRIFFTDVSKDDQVEYIKTKRSLFELERVKISAIAKFNGDIKSIVKKGIEVKESIFNNDVIINGISLMVAECVSALKNGNRIYWCGNGGSAADAQHLAAELSGRFYYDRDPLPSEALHCNTSYITAVGNDYGYELIYSRLIKGIGREGDILIGLSTSGKSPNVINGFDAAKKIGMRTIGMTGNGGNFRDHTDLTIEVPSNDTPRIQECHILIGHIICQLIEEQIYPQNEA